MAVGADRAHARAVLVVDRALELGVDVLAHLVAADAELLSVGPRKAVGAGREHDERDAERHGEDSRAERDARAGLAALAQVLPPAHRLSAQDVCDRVLDVAIVLRLDDLVTLFLAVNL